MIHFLFFFELSFLLQGNQADRIYKKITCRQSIRELNRSHWLISWGINARENDKKKIFEQYSNRVNIDRIVS